MKKKTKAKKPRTLNAVWADARCWIYPDPETEYPHRMIELTVETTISAKQALRLSQWLAEAAAWKADE